VNLLPTEQMSFRVLSLLLYRECEPDFTSSLISLHFPRVAAIERSPGREAAQIATSPVITVPSTCGSPLELDVAGTVG